MGKYEPINQELKRNKKYQVERNYPNYLMNICRNLSTLQIPVYLEYNIDLDVGLFPRNLFFASNISESIYKRLNMVLQFGFRIHHAPAGDLWLLVLYFSFFFMFHLGTFFVFSSVEGIGSISKMSKRMEGHRYYSHLSLFPMDFFNMC